MPFVAAEAVADEELVRNGKADVPHREIVDQPAVRPVEQRRGGERAGPAQRERLPQVVQRQAGVNDVLDEQDVTVADVGVEVLEQANAGARAGCAAAVVARERKEVQLVQDRDRPREVGEEDEARRQRSDEQRLAAGVVGGDLPSQLGDARADLLVREVDAADVVVDG